MFRSVISVIALATLGSMSGCDDARVARPIDSWSTADRIDAIRDSWNKFDKPDRLDICDALATQGVETVAYNIADPILEEAAGQLDKKNLHTDLVFFLTNKACP